MAIWQKAYQAQKAIRNVGRLRQILGAMTRFGFGTLVSQLPFKKEIPADALRSPSLVKNYPLAVRVRLLCEELGPTFIKIGQILAGRPDFIPLDWSEELSKLQDRVSPIPFSEIKTIIEENFEKKLEDLYSSFDTEAMASASIAQVHKARLLGGEEVVVKVLKPNVEKQLRQDFEILELIADAAHSHIEEVKNFRLPDVVNEFKKTLSIESDFERERMNIEAFQRNFQDSDFLVVPKLYPSHSNRSVLTMEILKGIKLNERKAIEAHPFDRKVFLNKSLRAFNNSMMKDGLFHADPHGGNLILLEGDRMGVIDYGSVGRLSHEARDVLINMFLALVSGDYSRLIEEYLSLSSSSKAMSSSVRQKITREVEEVYSPYYGLPLSQIPAGKLLLDASQLAFRHQLTLPRDLIMVFKSIATIEGIGRSLSPDFDLLSSASEFATDLIKSKYSPKRLARQFLLQGHQWSQLLKRTPHRLNESLRQLEEGQLKIQIEDLNAKENNQNFYKAIQLLALSLISITLLCLSVFFFYQEGIFEWLQYSLLIVSVALTAGVLYKALK